MVALVSKSGLSRSSRCLLSAAVEPDGPRAPPPHIRAGAVLGGLWRGSLDYLSRLPSFCCFMPDACGGKHIAVRARLLTLLSVIAAAALRSVRLPRVRIRADCRRAAGVHRSPVVCNPPGRTRSRMNGAGGAAGWGRRASMHPPPRDHQGGTGGGGRCGALRTGRSRCANARTVSFPRGCEGRGRGGLSSGGGTLVRSGEKSCGVDMNRGMRSPASTSSAHARRKMVSSRTLRQPCSIWLICDGCSPARSASSACVSPSARRRRRTSRPNASVLLLAIRVILTSFVRDRRAEDAV